MSLWRAYPTGGSLTDGASQRRGGVSSTQEGARSDAVESRVIECSERPGRPARADCARRLSFLRLDSKLCPQSPSACICQYSCGSYSIGTFSRFPRVHGLTYSGRPAKKRDLDEHSGSVSECTDPLQQETIRTVPGTGDRYGCSFG